MTIALWSVGKVLNVVDFSILADAIDNGLVISDDVLRDVVFDERVRNQSEFYDFDKSMIVRSLFSFDSCDYLLQTKFYLSDNRLVKFVRADKVKVISNIDGVFACDALTGYVLAKLS